MDDIQKFLNSLSPYIRRAWDARMPVDWEIPLRFIYDYEICFIKAGTVNVWAEDTLYEGRAGDVFFFVPGQLHSIRSVGSERVWQPHIHFDFFFDEYSEGLEVPIKMPHPNEHMRRNVFNDYPSLKIPTKTTFSNPYEADELIARIIAECAGLDPLKAIRCKSLLFDLLYLLLSRRFAPSGGAGEKRAPRAGAWRASRVSPPEREGLRRSGRRNGRRDRRESRSWGKTWGPHL